VDGLRLEPSFADLPTTPRKRTLDIRFTGSGSEYFRIWAVNLLLILVTLGLYLPFAKARRIRYFYANTLIDGQALSFHGDPWKMCRGFVLLVVVFGLYLGLGALSPGLGAGAFVALVLLWPPLWRAGLRFRLANTSWRGLRFGFTGSVVDAYKAFLPAAIPLALLEIVPVDGSTVDKAISGVAAIAFNLLAPWALGLAKRYQHNHYGYARQQTRTTLHPSQVWGLSFKAGLMGSLTAILLGIAAAAFVPALWNQESWLPTAGVALLAVLAVLAVLAWVIASAVLTAGLQNLAWSQTASDDIRFYSALSTAALMRLTVKNWLLMIVTLGLYRPFAAVATTRLKLEAVTLETSVDLDTLAGNAAAADANASGDFAGDFFGIDLGL